MKSLPQFSLISSFKKTKQLETRSISLPGDGQGEAKGTRNRKVDLPLHKGIAWTLGGLSMQVQPLSQVPPTPHYLVKGLMEPFMIVFLCENDTI